MRVGRYVVWGRSVGRRTRQLMSSVPPVTLSDCALVCKSRSRRGRCKVYESLVCPVEHRRCNTSCLMSCTGTMTVQDSLSRPDLGNSSKRNVNLILGLKHVRMFRDGVETRVKDDGCGRSRGLDRRGVCLETSEEQETDGPGTGILVESVVEGTVRKGA